MLFINFQILSFAFVPFFIEKVICQEQYDFIVVGGGVGGCAVARRLAENGKFSVLLMESGGYPLEGSEIPANAPMLVSNAELTFRYPSTHQPRAGLRNNGVITTIGGRMLGGGSSINYLWFNRGSPRDYDRWANITGDDSWNYSNMLRHLKNVESYAGDFPSDQHSLTGPITITRPKYAPGLDYWLEAGRSLGYQVADPNGPQRISFGPVEFSKKFGRRVSSYTGYLLPVLGKANLKVMTHTNATSIIFRGKRAVGVKFQTQFQNQQLLELPDNAVYAKKEIIISAGAYESPLLLQRSGIGPRQVLESAGISVIKDLPVGMNYHDHVALPIHVLIRNKSAVMDEARDLTPETLEFYNQYGDGPYSNTRGGTGQAFVASSVAISEGEEDWADLHICMAHSKEPYLSAYVTSDTSGGDEELDGSEVPMSISVFLVRPKSRGSILINATDPLGLPIMDVGYFSNDTDFDRMLDGVKEAITIVEQTEPYRRLGARVITFGIDECKNEEEDSRKFWKCYIKYISEAGLHAGGTCRMGKGPEDAEAVVDSKLRVIGIQGLRVVDNSIAPVITNANPQAAVYGIAEKASEMILKDWFTQ